MDYDIFNLILRIILLQVLAVLSQTALGKKHYAIAFFSFGVWTTIFRLTLLRAIALYIGVFGKESEIVLSNQLLDFLSCGMAASITSTFVFIGATFLLVDVIKSQREVK